MSRKHFSWLAALAVVATLVAVFMPRQTSRVDSFEPAPLLPGFAARANAVDWLQITAAGGEVLATLERGEAGWTVAEASGYAADWDVLRPLLAGLARAEVVEQKTANPDYYDRLGVRDVDDPDAQGLRVSFAADSGFPAVILGTTAQGREGQYARVEGEAASALIDRELDLPKRREDWLDRTIVDIADSGVVEVVITHADGETVRASRVAADDSDFALEGVAAGFEPKSAWAVNALADGFASLRFDAVAPAGEIDWNGALRYRVVTADGLDVEATTVVLPAADGGDDAHWLRLQAGVYTTAVDGAVDEGEVAARAQERARAINDRVGGWAYRIPEYKATVMAKRMDDLVRAVEDENGDA